VRFEHLRHTRLRTVCPWKGLARYFSVEAEGAVSRNSAWTYHRPWPWIRSITDHVAFSNGVELRR
jgi:uncharacterized protein (DUF427 family)